MGELETGYVEVVVLRPVRGLRPGSIVAVNRDDSSWASKVAAGSAAYLGSVVRAVEDRIDDVDEASDEETAGEDE